MYGPGGPAPAMREAAETFERQTGIRVDITAGPTAQWLAQAKQNADLIYSGSETMMSDFVGALEGRISAADVEPLYLRPLAILVRPGNPRKIQGLKDLLTPGVKVLVVNGAGQNGVWEDMSGRLGDIETVRALRRNIVGFAPNSADALALWKKQPEIDAWVIWNIWAIAHPGLADVVSLEPEYAIYRDTAVALTTQGKTKPAARRFVDFLKSRAGAGIFKKWGWITPSQP